MNLEERIQHELEQVLQDITIEYYYEYIQNA
jgi:hypothetical protein